MPELDKLRALIRHTGVSLKKTLAVPYYKVDSEYSFCKYDLSLYTA